MGSWWYGYYFWGMENKRKTESVKLSASVVKKVKADKKKTGVAIGRFFEIAALEKLERNNPKTT